MPEPTSDPGKISFEAEIHAPEPKGSYGWVEFPYDLKSLYGIGNLVPAVMTFDGIEYRGSIAKMGGSHPVLLMRRDVLARVGKHAGDMVAVTVSLDTAPRPVEVPPQLSDALAACPGATLAFDQLAPSHRRQYASWVSSAKQESTKARRAQKAVDMIMQK